MKFKIMLLISIVILMGLWVLTRRDNKVRMIFCDVGQGDGMIISQNSFQMVIDTGPDNKKMMGCLERELPFWDKNLEVVIITHEDADHNGGLKDIQNYYKIENLYGMKSENEQDIYTNYLQKGDVIEMGLVRFEALNPSQNEEDKNKGSIVGLVSIDKIRILLMGDVTTEIEQKLVWQKQLSKVDILKAAHHGSKEATSEELLEMVRPEEVVISVGKNNRFGHPTKEVVERVKRRNIKLRRTDVEGQIKYIY